MQDGSGSSNKDAFHRSEVNLLNRRQLRHVREKIAKKFLVVAIIFVGTCITFQETMKGKMGFGILGKPLELVMDVHLTACAHCSGLCGVSICLGI
jgi:hypothetical protein